MVRMGLDRINGSGVGVEKDHDQDQDQWNFGPNEALEEAGRVSIRGMIDAVASNVDHLHDPRPLIALGHGDPAVFPCFRTAAVAEEAVADALMSAKYNSYAPNVGVQSARKAVAEYLNRDLPHKLSAEDVYMTLGCTQAIETVLSVLARPHANILLPRPGFPFYEARCAFAGLEARHFDLLPDQNWEVDLDAVETLTDSNTVAMVIINPGNPCGNVYSYQHLSKIAQTAKRLGILVISDEVYDHLTFGSNPFVPMGTFGSVVPVLTLGAISKRWGVPGWRLGWLVTVDPNGVLKKTKIVDSIRSYLNICADPATFIQGALPRILEETKPDFFEKMIGILRQSAEICCSKLKEIKSVTCPHKPEGAFFIMVKLNLSLLENISNDYDFCCKLAREEKIVTLPGSAVGMKGWVRLTFAIEPASLEVAMGRIKSFCDRHTKSNM